MANILVFSTNWISNLQKHTQTWLKLSKDGTHYEYIVVYVDDLAICMQDPLPFCDTLKEKYKLNLKGIGPISYLLG